jgi:hypothetical protein
MGGEKANELAEIDGLWQAFGTPILEGVPGLRTIERDSLTLWGAEVMGIAGLHERAGDGRITIGTRYLG